jgi:DNA polymerase-4
MVGRRLREHQLHARTVQLKLRHSDFSTITRAHSFSRATQIDNEIYSEIVELFHANWQPGTKIRLLGVQTSGFTAPTDQLDLLDGGKAERWRQALEAADHLRDKYGERAVGLAKGMKSVYRERVHEGQPKRKRS